MEQTALGDLDGDGDLDLVVGRYYWAGWWYRNQGDGTFGYAGGISSGENGANTVELADFNGDGLLDMMVGGYWSLTVRLNNGTGNAASVVSVPVPPGMVRAMTSGDFDGDGDVDMMAAPTWGPGLLYLNDGSASFTTVSQPLFLSSEEHAVAAADVDGAVIST